MLTKNDPLNKEAFQNTFRCKAELHKATTGHLFVKLPHWCVCIIYQARRGPWGRSAPPSLTATLQPVQHKRRAEILASQFPVDLLFNKDSWIDTNDVRTMNNLARIRGEKNGQRRFAQRKGRETLFFQEPRQKVLLKDSQECSHQTARGAPDLRPWWGIWKAWGQAEVWFLGAS